MAVYNDDSDIGVSELEQAESESPGQEALQQVVHIVNTIGKRGFLTKEEKAEVLEEIHREKQFGIMACGVTGTGKSSLLNGIAGKCVFKEGDNLQHETITVNKHTLVMDNSHLIICDTPGFCDSSGDEERYVRIIGDACQDMDVLMYCISMANPKASMDNHDANTLRNLKRALKEEIWNHCVIVLTFANEEVTRLEQKKVSRIEKEFRNKITSWEKKVKEIFRASGIDAANIPVVPAGVKTRPSLLPGDDKWLSVLWYTVCEKASSDGQSVLALHNADRLKSRSEVGPSDFEKKELHEQPIVPLKTWKEKVIAKLPVVGAALGAGGAAGVTGATIGAIIGALAIGIPSFGIAAGLGLVLGGAIGGGAGVGVGVVAANAIEEVKKRKALENAQEVTSDN